MAQPSLTEILRVATEAAYLAGRRTLAYFNTGVAVETKADQTPVTRADREAEQVIRDSISRFYPDHAILGEEQGQTTGNPDYRWIIDPIDGTKSFIHGVPMYGVLIGVEVHGEPRVGVIYLPALDELVAAAEGMGCTWNGRPARVSAVDQLADATLLTGSPISCLNRSDGWSNLAAKVKLNRGWGDCYGYALVATGRAEIMLDPALNAWDAAPMLPILREAGGHFTTWDGKPSIWGTDGCATNGKLNAAVLDVLRTEKKK